MRGQRSLETQCAEIRGQRSEVNSQREAAKCEVQRASASSAFGFPSPHLAWFGDSASMAIGGSDRASLSDERTWGQGQGSRINKDCSFAGPPMPKGRAKVL